MDQPSQISPKSDLRILQRKIIAGRKKVKSDLLQGSKTISFTKQYQVDDINPKYRRIVIRNYKIIYTNEKNIIQVMDIVSTKQSPEVLRNK